VDWVCDVKILAVENVSTESGQIKGVKTVLSSAEDQAASIINLYYENNLVSHE
jgi:hypothetical protein